VIVVGVDGKIGLETSPLFCHIETQVFMHGLLRVPGCPASALGQDIMGKLGMVLFNEEFAEALIAYMLIRPWRGPSLRPQP
jgi:hypothetical protein